MVGRVCFSYLQHFKRGCMRGKIACIQYKFKTRTVMKGLLGKVEEHITLP